MRRATVGTVAIILFEGVVLDVIVLDVVIAIAPQLRFLVAVASVAERVHVVVGVHRSPKSKTLIDSPT